MDPQLMTMFLPLVLVLVLLLDIVRSVRNTHWTRDPSVDNLVFDAHLLWEVETQSRLHCAERCAEDVDCKTFTFTKLGPDSVKCRGHSQAVTSGGTNAASTKLYNLVQPAQGIYSVSVCLSACLGLSA